MKAFQRILAVLLCLVMSLGMISMVASAATTIDPDASGTLIIHKYELNTAAGEPGDGTEITDTGAFGTALDDVTFTAYMVKDADATIAYYSGSDTTEVSVADFLTADGDFDTTKQVVGTSPVTGTTVDGVATLSLDVGMYVVVETDHPDKVTDPADPFLVSIPMTNPDNETEWMYTVHVYPKNKTSEGNVSLKKTNADGSPIAEVEFKLEKQDGENWVVQGDNKETSSTGEVSWPSLTLGTYRVTEISAPAGYIVDDRPIVFTVNDNNTITCSDSRAGLTVGNNNQKAITLTLVNEKPEFDKEITANENIASVGETVSYSLTTTVPTNITEMETYTITDAPKGLSVVENTIAVKVDNAAVDASAYNKEKNADGGFTLTFTPSAMAAYAGKELVITYDATVTTAAVAAATGKNANEAPNTATLTYSNSLETTSTYDIDDDEVTKLYQANITKKLDSNEGKAAEGVVFNAYDNANCTTALKFTEETDGTYTLDPAGSVTELVTDASGKIVINGLGQHTYYLVETETVEGYNLLSGSVEMKVGDETDYKYDITIVNKKGFNLPQTGGIGTLMFIIIGGVLMAGGICLIVPNKKRAV